MSLTVHLINHTHWDRDWFLTHVYTSRLIPGLIDHLAELVAQNPQFRYFLDGQTLVIEDLLNLAPGYRATVERLVGAGNLIIGPYYCQPDWRLTGGEALMRNLLYGQQDSQRFGVHSSTGWLVDTFGHISQTPQLHQLFAIRAVYVWRGVPDLTPYFRWQSPDGSQVLAINLFGGYRNLYGVTHVPVVATRRLQTEAQRLQPYYPTADVPLFDGYDLEDDPEDPLTFFATLEIPPDLVLRGSSPEEFAQTARWTPDLPPIEGELLSGKYGATFPGTLSARTYLKVMAHDCEHWLYRVCEPLAGLASLYGRPYPAATFERWARMLLQNAIHDGICGVSIDLVHEKMEYIYRQVFDGLQSELAASLRVLLGVFAPGEYAVSTNPFHYEGWQVVGQQLLHVKTGGVGVWPLGAGEAVETPEETVESFTWQNDHYQALVRPDGAVQIGEAVLGTLILRAEAGDTYSDEPGERLATGQPQAMVLEQRSAHHCVLRMSLAFTVGAINLSVTARVIFDSSPLIRWVVDLDSRGTDFRLESAFQTGHGGQVVAGMPFDVVTRPAVDRDLLPRDLPAELSGLLLGQREVSEVRTFPFHDFVALTNGGKTSAVFARGLHSYRMDEEGRISITLRRAVEWLTRPDLRHRVGDAGPLFYVPDARCERQVRHELAFAAGVFSPTDVRFQQLNAGFQNPPLLVRAAGNGEAQEWPVFQENLPLDSLHLHDGKMLVRLHNPAGKAHRLSRRYPAVDVQGRRPQPTQTVGPKQISTLVLEARALPSGRSGEAEVELLNPPRWRVGAGQGVPDPTIVEQLQNRARQLEAALEEIKRQQADIDGPERRRLEHQYYVQRRELLEVLLSVRLNKLKSAMAGQWTEAYLFEPDEEVLALGLELNRMRIKRRIYDYVVQVDAE